MTNDGTATAKKIALIQKNITMSNMNQRNQNNGVQILNELDRFFTNALRPTQTLTPKRYCSKEDESAWYLRIELPGFSKEQIEVSLKEGVLALEATPAEGDEYLSTYRKQFTLPEGVDSSQLKADFANGVLLLTLPKAIPVEAKLRKIEVNG